MLEALSAGPIVNWREPTSNKCTLQQRMFTFLQTSVLQRELSGEPFLQKGIAHETKAMCGNRSGAAQPCCSVSLYAESLEGDGLEAARRLGAREIPCLTASHSRQRWIAI
jgi:hypothetical protein